LLADPPCPLGLIRLLTARGPADLDGSSYHLAGIEGAPDRQLCGPEGEGDLIS